MRVASCARAWLGGGPQGGGRGARLLQGLHLRLQRLDALRRALELREELLVLALQPRLQPRHLLHLLGELHALALALRTSLAQLPLQPRVALVHLRQLLLQAREAQRLLPAELREHGRLALLAAVSSRGEGLQRVEAVHVAWPHVGEDESLASKATRRRCCIAHRPSTCNASAGPGVLS